jgi:hypothetical protein
LLSVKFPYFGGVSAAQFFVKMEKYTKRLTGWFCTIQVHCKIPEAEGLEAPFSLDHFSKIYIKIIKPNL